MKQRKIMFTDERGSSLFLVVRGTKMLSAIERHNLKRWGFRTTDRKEYALYIGLADSLPSLRGLRLMIQQIGSMGFQEVDRAIAARMVKTTTRLADEECARYSRMMETSVRHTY